MILVVALMVAVIGAVGVLIVAGLGWLLSRWLGSPAPLIAAAIIVAAGIADCIFIRNLLNQPGDSNSKVVTTIFAWAYGAPLLIAALCVLGLLRVGLKH